MIRDSFLGNVAEVSATEVVLQLTGSEPEDGSNGTPGNVGDFVVIDCNNFALFGQLTNIKLLEDPEAIDDYDQDLIGLVELLSTVENSSGTIHPGILVPPKVGAEVHAANSNLVHKVVASTTGSTGSSVSLNLGTLVNSKDASVDMEPEKLFGRHLAVLGASGSGKSWSLAKLIEESARFKSKVILIDATGEFKNLDSHTRHVHFGDDPRPAAKSKEVSLPYTHLTESDLFAIFQPQGESQAPKLRGALTSLKLAHFCRDLAPDGTIIKAHKPKEYFEEEYVQWRQKISRPFAKFEISLLARQIRNECVFAQRGPDEAHVWGGLDGKEYSRCVPLVTRIEDILDRPNLAPIFNPQNTTPLFEEIRDFFKDPKCRVLCVSMQYLSFQHHAREIVANAIGRHLLEIARRDYFRTQPLLVVVDEAHQFLNKTINLEHTTYPLDSFALMAKEGRKYGLNICIATQRPRDIPEGVLSQVGALLVHRTTNDHDRALIESASGDVDSSLVKSASALTPGRAILFGVDFRIPLTLDMNAPSARPNSEGPNFQKYWKANTRVKKNKV